LFAPGGGMLRVGIVIEGADDVEAARLFEFVSLFDSCGGVEGWICGDIVSYWLWDFFTAVGVDLMFPCK